METENTLRSIETEAFRQGDVLLRLLNTSEGDGQPTETLKKGIIHFYFCVEGEIQFQFGPHYARSLAKQKAFLFFNPESEISCKLLPAPSSKMVMLEISLSTLHQLFMHEPLPFLKPENINRKFYDEKEISSALHVTLHQLYNVRLSENAAPLFFQGKVYEILGLYFSEKKPDTESCPFLNDEETVRKIKQSKEHLLKNATNPPGLKELARLHGLNEYQLKVGFKEIYGNTVFGYLLDHKLDHARTLLDSGKLQVSEVAFQIGYSNPSHFIAAFKKKFGITPKKYLMNQATPKASLRL
jgi:AraC-like DNA-binding protein